ncbi:MAG: class I SAM-dependent methyltransferase [Hyphomicrobiaceae bacterium]
MTALSTPDTSARAIAAAYDEVPYESRPFPQTHPARSAALARVFGLTPPDVENARILELGCASGGNIIPLASAFPRATFVGVDLSPNQVEAGRARIAQAGLTNITLRQQSILDLSRGHGTFDYIICHGVYSWVPQPVRDAILRVAHENLSENGVAYISYNVHPGWRLRGVLREAMLFHAGGESNPAARAGKARAFLNQLAEIADGATPYGQLLRQEAKAMAGHEDYYILHDHLEHTNDPCYVGEFLAKAKNAGLAYLTEANFNITIAESFGAEKGRALRELSENNLDRMEQYIDFLTGRTFRQTLLVQGTQAAKIVRSLSPSCLEGLNVQARVSLVQDASGPSTTAESDSPVYALRDAAGRTLTTGSAYVRDCLVNLGAHYPRTLTPTQVASSGLSLPHGPAHPGHRANLLPNTSSDDLPILPPASSTSSSAAPHPTLDPAVNHSGTAGHQIQSVPNTSSENHRVVPHSPSASSSPTPEIIPASPAPVFPAVTEAQHTLILDALFKMLLIGMADVTTVPFAPQMTLDERPRALDIARADASAGRAWTTNARHENVTLNIVQLAVLPLLDGTNDTDALVEVLRAKAREGRIVFQHAGTPLTDDDAIHAAAREHLTAALTTLTSQAVMVAA